jgi:hypothetical protein
LRSAAIAGIGENRIDAAQGCGGSNEFVEPIFQQAHLVGALADRRLNDQARVNI